MNAFTGDGSTTTFDLTHEVRWIGGNEIQVFVDNVRQQEVRLYTGQDGSGDNKRITFTSGLISQSIFVKIVQKIFNKLLQYLTMLFQD